MDCWNLDVERLPLIYIQSRRAKRVTRRQEGERGLLIPNCGGTLRLLIHFWLGADLTLLAEVYQF